MYDNQAKNQTNKFCYRHIEATFFPGTFTNAAAFLVKILARGEAQAQSNKTSSSRFDGESPKRMESFIVHCNSNLRFMGPFTMFLIFNVSGDLRARYLLWFFNASLAFSSCCFALIASSFSSLSLFSPLLLKPKYTERISPDKSFLSSMPWSTSFTSRSICCWTLSCAAIVDMMVSQSCSQIKKWAWNEKKKRQV